MGLEQARTTGEPSLESHTHRQFEGMTDPRPKCAARFHMDREAVTDPNAHVEEKLRKTRARPISAAPRPVWRPVASRPSWPLDAWMPREQERVRLGSPPREQEGPRKPRRTGYRGPVCQARAEVCELRDIPRIRARVAKSKASTPLPELYISRRLNWPPRGLQLAPQVMDRNSLVLASYPQRRPRSPRPASAR